MHAVEPGRPTGAGMFRATRTPRLIRLRTAEPLLIVNFLVAEIIIRCVHDAVPSLKENIQVESGPMPNSVLTPPIWPAPICGKGPMVAACKSKHHSERKEKAADSL